MEDEKIVDTFTRVMGWIIVGLSGYSVMEILLYIDSLNLPNLVRVLVWAPLFWISWLGLLLMHEKFDIIGDRRKGRK